MKVIDLTGRRVGHLTVIGREGSKNRSAYWQCRCDCGNTHIVNGASLRSEHTKSCGCRGKSLHPELTHEYLKEILNYDPLTGIFVWKKPIWGHIPGEVANRVTGKYRRVPIHGASYQVHRLGWFYVHGTWPEGELDHKNRRPDQNQIDNLRQATSTLNGMNKGLIATNKSGYQGVSWHKRASKWSAFININGKCTYLGLFSTPEGAAQAYDVAAEKHYGDFAYLNFSKAA